MTQGAGTGFASVPALFMDDLKENQPLAYYLTTIFPNTPTITTRNNYENS